MSLFRDAEAMAKALREGLAASSHNISRAQAMELVAKQFGLSDWAKLAARLRGEETEKPEEEPAVQLKPAIPVLRSFDEAKAREFYIDFLGFSVDWEHRQGRNAPLYMQISRGDLQLHLSEHHGDASPGMTIFARVEGIEALHDELIAKNYRHNRPGLETQSWGREVLVNDPFGNRIRFCEQRHNAAEG